MRGRFYWDQRNRDHLFKHSVSEREAEEVVSGARSPYPRKTGEGKFIVWGSARSGRLLQVIFVSKAPEQLDYEEMSLRDILEMDDSSAPLLCIIHARDLTKREKAQYRRLR